MCDTLNEYPPINGRTIPLEKAIGTILAHDITEIRQGEFKGRAFRKGHVIRKEDVCHLQRLGKENLFVLEIADDEMHEDDAAYAVAQVLMGEGVGIKGEPKEGKITLIAERDGLLSIDSEALLQFNMLGDVMCATLHDRTVVKKGQEIAGTRAIPLVIKKTVVEEAIRIIKGPRVQGDEGSRVRGFKGSCSNTPESQIPGIPYPYIPEPHHSGIIAVKEMRKPKVGVVVTGNEVYHGKITDAFGSIVESKIKAYGGEVAAVYFAPDDALFIEARLRELIDAGCDLLITTGGMSVDPDDVTRFAIRNLGATDITYGSAVLPGAMFLVAYLKNSNEKSVMSNELKNKKEVLSPITHHPSQITVLGIPACGMYHKTTIFDLILPRVLAGEKIGRKELAELGHGGLCMNCEVCRYPVCPFGKG
ncbi:MAG: molybdopterin-binding protein [Nitrospirota bacterium]|nr:molybdopterin-binding protein [Nitrospirota bacterium]